MQEIDRVRRLDVFRTCVGESRNSENSSMPRDPRAWRAAIVLTPDR